MKRVMAQDLKQSATYALIGGIVTGLLTLACYRLGLSLGAAAPLYLLIVVLQSLTGDFLSASLISIGAATCLDFFFAEPIFTLRIMRPSDILALVLFLMTALIITKLVSRLRSEVRR